MEKHLITIPYNAQDMRLDRWLKTQYPHLHQGAIEQALRKKLIRLNSARGEASMRLNAGDTLEIADFLLHDNAKTTTPKPSAPAPLTKAQKEGLRAMVVHTHEDFYILNKPAGLAVQGGSKQRDSIDHRLDALSQNNQRPLLVHRLDKDTSGLLLVARHAPAARNLTALFADRALRKTYIALLHGTPPALHGEVDAAMQKSGAHEKMHIDPNGQRAITHYTVLDQLGDRLSLVQLEPLTGRTHQLRVHMAHLGCPIYGDGKYGAKSAFDEQLELARQLHLHAWRLELPAPYNLHMEVPLPSHLQDACNKYGLTLG